jgi:hypothetical protein
MKYICLVIVWLPLFAFGQGKGSKKSPTKGKVELTPENRAKLLQV